MGEQPPFKYSAKVEKSEANTSHAIVMGLVGSGKRVLDLGCATGYLAEALVAEGNTVSGVDIDAEAAEVARPFLERLVVGDLEQMDLVAEFGEKQFDVLVYADVLEHLKDPVQVLRRSRPLLADGGYVVVSIPNVAHGSVRLALLKGRFDYRPVGLLDDTHLRFFTRDHLEELLYEAGFVSVDSRQTSASPFETEIPLERGDYPPDVVAAVEADPESWVYQFVARIEPVDGMSGGSGHGELLAQRTLELHRLRRTLDSIARQVGREPSRPVIGILDPVTESLSARSIEEAAVGAIRMAVVVRELSRRLAGFEVRCYTLSQDTVVSEVGEDAVQSLAPWGDGSAPELRREVDALVVLPAALSPEAEACLAQIAETGLPLRPLPTGGDHPDALVLARRLADRGMLNLRREYLAVTGQAPASSAYVLCLPGSAAGPELDERTRRPVIRPDRPISPLDLLSLVDSADEVVTSSPAVEALAMGLGLEPSADSDRLAVLASLADRDLDDLHSALLEDSGSRLASSVAERLQSLQRRVAALQAVNYGLRQSLARERSVMAVEVRQRDGQPQAPAGPWSGFHVDRLSRDLNAAHAQMANLQAEIDRIYATRTMRTVAPVRRIYGRLRRLIPGR